MIEFVYFDNNNNNYVKIYIKYNFYTFIQLNYFKIIILKVNKYMIYNDLWLDDYVKNLYYHCITLL